MNHTEEPAIEYAREARFKRIIRLHTQESARLLKEKLKAEEDWKDVPRVMRSTFLQLGLSAYSSIFSELREYREGH